MQGFNYNLSKDWTAKIQNVKDQITKKGAVSQHCSSSSAPQLPTATITPAITVDLLPGNGGILWL
jgi:hypothetical protein